MRREVHAGRATPKQYANLYGMAVDTIRRAIRGDTYQNVAELPGAAIEDALPPQVDSRGREESAASVARILKRLGPQRGEKEEAPDAFDHDPGPDPEIEEAAEALERDVQKAYEESPDRLVEELERMSDRREDHLTRSAVNLGIAPPGARKA